MTSFQWSPEFIAVAVAAALVASALGYLLACVFQGRKIAQLQADIHEKTLAESKLQSLLDNSEAAERRLDEALIEQRESALSQQRALKELEEKAHSVENQLHVAQSENRALDERIEDVLTRLNQTTGELARERNLVSELKDQLSNQAQKSKQFEVEKQDVRERLEESRQSEASLADRHGELQERHQALIKEHAELKTTLERKEEHFKEQMQQLGETRQSLTKEFENLANKIFEEKGKTFTHTSQSSIDSMLKPFRQQIEGFQKRINEVHDASIQGNTSLGAEIKKVLEVGLSMSKEASNLTTALKGDSQQRGAWGEAQLRRTLEMSGLIEDAHYEVQSSFKDDEGRQKQTDYLIKLPDGKHIIIDSKVSLNAYDRAVAADGPEEYQLALGEHLKAVRKHIDDLASKDYTNLVGMRSPSFVLMFMPIEPAYIEALKNNKDLFEYGYKKGIVLVSHTTLIPILRTVSNLWMIERSNAEAKEISEKAGDIYNQVCVVAERLSKLGGTLSTVSNHYNNTVKALAGQQGLYGKVDRFSQLSAKVSKTLPQLEATHMDFEAERLALIAEPLSDDEHEALASEKQGDEPPKEPLQANEEQVESTSGK